MYGYLKKSGEKVIYRTSAYSKSEENRCKTVDFKEFVSDDTVRPKKTRKKVIIIGLDRGSGRATGLLYDVVQG